MSLGVVVGVFIAVIAAVISLISVPAVIHGLRPCVQGYRDSEVQEVLEWQRDPTLLFSINKPLLWRNSPANDWPAAKKWTPQHFAELPSLRAYTYGVSRSRDPNFLFHSPDPHPFANLDCFRCRNNETESVKLSLAEFWQRRPADAFTYFTHELGHFPGLEADLHLADFSPNSTAPNPNNINIWMGSKGVVATTHYDNSFNFYVQLYGHKKFSLFPPSSHAQMRLFPSLHPSSRSALYEFTRIDFGCLERHDVVLGPGDVLTIPPFWFHRVEALNDSISVNLWHHSPAGWLQRRVEELPIPIEEEWDEDVKLTVIRSFMDLVLPQVVYQPASEFLKQLWQSRYSHFERDFAEHIQAFPHRCNLRVPLNRTHFHLRGSEVAAVFREEWNPSIREIVMGNVIEQWVAFIGGPLAVPGFLRKCVNH